MRLRTKFLLSLLLISASLTWASLLIVRHQIQGHVRQEILENLRDSVTTFQNFQRQREAALTASAAVLADQPIVKAMMTTQHPATIQDASTDMWQLSGSDVFVLADRTGRLSALHTSAAGLTRDLTQGLLQRSLVSGASRDWWSDGDDLFEVFFQPIYFGPSAENNQLGVMAVGYAIDRRVAAVISQVASSQVAFRYGNSIMASTLSPGQQSELRSRFERDSSPATGPADILLGGERFVSSSVELAPGKPTPVSLTVLESYDRATAFLHDLNRLLLWLGVLAVVAGSALVFVISDTFTRPLANLVAGVRALEHGDFGFPLKVRSRDEVSELTRAFDRMRHSLRQTQDELLRTERLATVGRMANTISHDLRHPLTAILAYAEFLADSKLPESERQGLYREVRLAVEQMTDQINSLLGFSKSDEEIHPVRANVDDVIQRAIQIVHTRAEFRPIPIEVSHEGSTEAWFDRGKFERVLRNLLLNACEAVDADTGRIEVRTTATADGLEIRVADNGRGVPEEIRKDVFQPFVSHGKENGIGLGLAVVQRIMQAHGGKASIESTGPSGTVFKVSLPSRVDVDREPQRVSQNQ
jgi:signal transduction histidine kinase